ncbi:transglycosylase SLT domain-containing protein [Bradyrhizobium sp. KB893862 SZCCT0404]|uniref:transglycosylase SLT domain-containing protein n=1 Tax=Bradyrhizobium sp. KB893862 SZCCT0404 TaxID=2807672 RepID=UPI001BA6AE61|nr:transglycosylase SLT domain-containing protein [Bradyrhizobium sp. KB893862 SZCCT0404]MBR1175868.1 transglycosylase SLT domain-containing protein [Bradyrhizobium sp. KB893862 SZCCT0404]
MPRRAKSLLSRFRGFRRSARWVRKSFAHAPRTFRIASGAAIPLAAFTLLNITYHVIRKPTELFVVVGNALDKEPADTWRQYTPLFRTYSTATVSPELLAALAQVESSGNPVARTYWRWRWSFNPLAIYRPASSAVGLFQMTDPAFAEAARFCVRGNAVTQTGCGSAFFYIRVIPRHAIELASVYLDRQVALVLTLAGDVKASAQQKQDLAAFIHLCGAGPAAAFARRKFQMIAGERCGDHLVAGYVARVNAMKRQFVRLAAEDS